MFWGARADAVNFFNMPIWGDDSTQKIGNNFSHTFVFDDECLQTKHKRMGGNKKGSSGSTTLITGF